MTSKRIVLVTGATSLIGDYLLPMLLDAGFETHAVSRSKARAAGCGKVFWHVTDITKRPDIAIHNADALIHLAPLRTLPSLLPYLAAMGTRRVIAFGSTSLFTKQNSGNHGERSMIQQLRTAEEELEAHCTKAGIEWTIFRPTLIYSFGRDKNVTTIARFVKYFRFFPLVGKGEGLRQPVHAEDLAAACIAALDNPATYCEAYNLSGGETLTYREMVIRIFDELGKRPFILTLPLIFLRILLYLLSSLRPFRHFNPEMANRINQDMYFDHSKATRDFGFSPRRFGLDLKLVERRLDRVIAE
jgi:nucleoside-diphosphate-sugar epimerase